MKVVVIGAAGGIGQPLSLLLKQDERVGALALVDLAPTQGIAVDLSHINTPAVVTAHDVSEEGKAEALAGADIVVITAGRARGPGMTREDLFNANARILSGLAESCAQHCPNAFICVVTNPVNAMVPLFKSVMERRGVYNAQKLFGVTTLDLVRASTFVAAASQSAASRLPEVPVIGGHSGATIIPLLSHVDGLELDPETAAALVQRIQKAGDEVVQAKDGKGSATLSMAHSAAAFVGKLLEAAAVGGTVTATAFIECELGAGLWKALGGEPSTLECPFFATEFTLSEEGVCVPRSPEDYLAQMSDQEKSYIMEMMPGLAAIEARGLSYGAPAGS